MNQLRIGLLWGALLLSGVTQAQTPSPAQLGLVVATPNVVQVLDSSKHWSTIGTVDATTHVFTVSGVAGIPEAPTGSGVLYGRKNSAWSTVVHTDITDWTATLTPYALLASPAFTGTPSLPTGATGVTQTPGDNSTKLATTAFVGAAVTAGATAPGGTAGQIQYKNGTVFGGFTASGDATINTGTGAVAVTKTGGVAFGGLATVTPGTGVATAAGSGVNTNGGLATATTSSVVVGAINTGGGSGVAPVGLADVAAGSYLKSGGVTTIPAWQAFGTGVQAAVALNANAAGGVALVSTVPTAGNFVKWAAGGLVDGGAGSGGGTVTKNSTPTSGYTAGQFLTSDGALAQADPLFTSIPAPTNGPAVQLGTTAAYMGNPGGTPLIILTTDTTNGGGAWPSVGFQLGNFGWGSSGTVVGSGGYYGFSALGYMNVSPEVSIHRNGPRNISVIATATPTSPTTFDVYNTYTDGSNGEWGTLDWKTTANVLTLGAQANGTGTLRAVNLVGASVSLNGAAPNTNGGLTTATTTGVVAGAINTGGGSGVAPVGLADVAAGSYLKSGGVTTIPAWQAFGTGVQAAVAINAGTTGSVALQSGAITTGDLVKWNGAAGVQDATVTPTTSGFISNGTKPTNTTGTCPGSSGAGGAMAGTFVLVNICAAAGTVIFTGMPTMPTGYSCDMEDRVTRAATIVQSAATTTSATFIMGTTPSVANDVFQFKCTGY